MTQLALVLPLPLARKRDPATSHAAANKAASIAPSHRNIIAAALREGPATVKQISDRCGLSQYAVSKRLIEMQRMGLIELTGRELEGCREWRRRADPS